MVELTEYEKNTFNIFHYLRKNLPKVNACTIRHVSTYIAITNANFDPSKDIEIFESDDNSTIYELNLSNGTKITFYNDFFKQLNFSVEKINNDIKLCAFVSTSDENLDSAYVHGEVDYKDHHFTMGITGNNQNGFIETYHRGNSIIQSISYFKLENDQDVSLDTFDGLGYVTAMLLRIELLYNNINNLNQPKLVRNK